MWVYGDAAEHTSFTSMQTATLVLDHDAGLFPTSLREGMITKFGELVKNGTCNFTTSAHDRNFSGGVLTLQ